VLWTVAAVEIRVVVGVEHVQVEATVPTVASNVGSATSSTFWGSAWLAVVLAVATDTGTTAAADVVSAATWSALPVPSAISDWSVTIVFWDLVRSEFLGSRTGVHLFESNKSPTRGVLLHDAVFVVAVRVGIVIAGLVDHVAEHVPAAGRSGTVGWVRLANNSTDVLVIELVSFERVPISGHRTKHVVVDIACGSSTVAVTESWLVVVSVVRSEEQSPAATVTISQPAVRLERCRLEVVVTAVNPVDAVLSRLEVLLNFLAGLGRGLLGESVAWAVDFLCVARIVCVSVRVNELVAVFWIVC